MAHTSDTQHIIPLWQLNRGPGGQKWRVNCLAYSTAQGHLVSSLHQGLKVVTELVKETLHWVEITVWISSPTHSLIFSLSYSLILSHNVP